MDIENLKILIRLIMINLEFQNNISLIINDNIENKTIVRIKSGVVQKKTILSF